jgi:GNAT superfamily N-acetyltransferase
MITYQEESFESIFEDALPILFKQWEELANHKEDRPLDISYDGYKKLNEEGTIRIFAVRDEGMLIGYASFALANNLHYQTWKYADCDVYYIDPEYRGNGVGLQMIKEIETWLKSLGVKSLVMHDKLNHSHEKFFLALGFNPIEKKYEKVLD